MRARLIRLALDLYPAAVRDRYGAEISELLAGSTQPWRDLADVGRAALGERLSEWRRTRTTASTLRGAGVQVRRLAWIATVPWGLSLASMLVATVLVGLVRFFGFLGVLPVTPTVDTIASVVAFAMVCAEAAWFADRRARLARPVAAVVTVPAALALGTVALLELLGTNPNGLTAAAVVWCAATAALGVASLFLARRGRRGLALVVPVVGGAVALDVSCAIWITAVHPVASAWLAPIVWPVALSGLARSSGGGIVGALSVPAVLTLCTAYALPLVVSVKRVTQLTEDGPPHAAPQR